MPKGIVALAVAVAAAAIAAAPWPVYRTSRYESRGYFRSAVAALGKQTQAERSVPSGSPLRGGWAVAPLELPEGTPLAGYGERNGRPATGTHDPLHVKALVLSDGYDTAVLVGSDLLVVPENVAQEVRKRVETATELTARQILFNASHTHSGPGGATRGVVARAFGGRYEAEVEAAVVGAFVDAIVRAARSLEPVEAGSFRARVPDLIRNRTRSASAVSSLVDDELWGLVVRKADGALCYLVRYSAHPTVVGAQNMSFSAEFPGALVESLERSGAEGKPVTAIYLAGAVGSMGPRPPEAPGGDFERAAAMGEALAAFALDAARGAPLSSDLPIEARGVPLRVPPLQVRISPRWRLSPLLTRLLGVNRSGWLSAVRIGSTVLLGFPCDYSGETSEGLKAWGAERGWTLVPLSFAGDYVGYVSPDAYYAEVYDAHGRLAYETGIMSWAGPEQDAFFLDLAAAALESLNGPVVGTDFPRIQE